MLKRPSPSVVAVVLTILIAYGLLSACTQPIPSASPRGDSGCSRWCAAGATEEPVTLPETETAVPTKMPMVTIVGFRISHRYRTPRKNALSTSTYRCPLPVIWMSSTRSGLRTRLQPGQKRPWRPCAEPWLSGCCGVRTELADGSEHSGFLARDDRIARAVRTARASAPTTTATPTM